MKLSKRKKNNKKSKKLCAGAIRKKDFLLSYYNDDDIKKFVLKLYSKNKELNNKLFKTFKIEVLQEAGGLAIVESLQNKSLPLITNENSDLWNKILKEFKDTNNEKISQKISSIDKIRFEEYFKKNCEYFYRNLELLIFENNLNDYLKNLVKNNESDWDPDEGHEEITSFFNELMHNFFKNSLWYHLLDENNPAHAEFIDNKYRPPKYLYIPIIEYININIPETYPVYYSPIKDIYPKKELMDGPATNEYIKTVIENKDKYVYFKIDAQIYFFRSMIIKKIYYKNLLRIQILNNHLFEIFNLNPGDLSNICCIEKEISLGDNHMLHLQEDFCMPKITKDIKIPLDTSLIITKGEYIDHLVTTNDIVKLSQNNLDTPVVKLNLYNYESTQIINIVEKNLDELEFTGYHNEKTMFNTELVCNSLECHEKLYSIEKIGFLDALTIKVRNFIELNLTLAYLPPVISEKLSENNNENSQKIHIYKNYISKNFPSIYLKGGILYRLSLKSFYNSKEYKKIMMLQDNFKRNISNINTYINMDLILDNGMNYPLGYNHKLLGNHNNEQSIFYNPEPLIKLSDDPFLDDDKFKSNNSLFHIDWLTNVLQNLDQSILKVIQNIQSEFL